MDLKKMCKGVVLAGGESSRFPFHKAFACIDGEYFYKRAVSCLKPAVSSVDLVAHPSIAHKLSDSSAKVIMDLSYIQGQGPLAGILTAMNSSEQAEWYAVITCDMPFMKTEIYDMLLTAAATTKGVQAVVPVVKECRQPLAALYHISCKPVITRVLSEGKRSMYSLLQNVDTKFITEDSGHWNPHDFININTPEDYSLYIE
ncbi:molybdenum cofactor guanylyltransferase [Fictibacillus terranigra]|uniref:Probable molybdenum cofactor guanylyltransferase n=1 Tax=Fictibacillus terranigra TaxID=3058424 RepID=A0ABT8EA54_9BACL|nr:molybdenum cofactor guanylyltransferase [Fictibacillus sp. CENA-BCM004]MDN4074749.1 molybdenum cofactor guanylyltransferase [Fictibacillus sp. CENA-BCM004]